uniref:Homologous-pairing protein 2 winged helix domain-containing protein n=1 Tax=Prolemur simus TaxID=1328070 RepID=A0A8C8YR80_PROSS
MSKGRAVAAVGATEILLMYLQEQNWPYSTQDVFRNLQQEHGLGKAVVVKALEQLSQQDKFKEKTYVGFCYGYCCACCFPPLNRAVG